LNTELVLRATLPGTPSAETENVPNASEIDRNRLLYLGFALSVVIGLGMRLAQYAVNRSLWLDESLLATNILDRSLAEIARPLDYGQTAPVGFLAVVRATVDLLGEGELVLRLVPLIAGIAALICFIAFVHSALSRSEAIVASALFSLSPFLIYYSSEVKQYSVDVFCSVILIWLANRAVVTHQSRRSWMLMALAGTIAVWFSQPSIFVLASVGLVEVALSVKARRWRDALPLAGIGTAWLISFAGSYRLSSRGLVDHEFMNAFWRVGFWPLPPRSIDDALWLPHALLKVFREPAGVMSDQIVHSVPMMVAGSVAAFFGVRALWRRNEFLGATTPVIFGLLLIASAAELYPFGGQFLTGGRVLLFALPFVFLLIAVGIVALMNRAKRLAIVLLAMMFVPFLMYSALGVPHVRAEVKPLLAYMQEEGLPEDRIYVHYEGRTQLQYYANRYGLSEARVTIGEPRVWVFFATDGRAAHAYDEKGLMLSVLDRLGTRLDDQVAIGSSVYLYDLSGGDVRALSELKIPVLPYDVAFDCRGPWAHERNTSGE
jgi:hypothetical protein